MEVPPVPLAVVFLSMAVRDDVFSAGFILSEKNRFTPAQVGVMQKRIDQMFSILRRCCEFSTTI